ncbi:MAG: hypothetical protein Kow0059_12830 [Candidatus Sumerlaeia bacterium]
MRRSGGWLAAPPYSAKGPTGWRGAWWAALAAAAAGALFWPSLHLAADADRPTTATAVVGSPPQKEPQLELDVPPSKQAIPILPPLSVEECVAALELIKARLGNPEISMTKWDPIETGRVFEYLEDYVRLTDRKHSALSNYTWNYLGENRVALGVVDRDSFYVTPALRNVSAISFTAAGGNVWVDRIVVVDVSDRQATIPVRRRILAGLPRKEIVFLNLPMTVKEVVVFYSAEPDDQPRVRLFGGVSRRPEDLKAALHYLGATRQAIAEGRREDALQAAEAAQRHLTNFLRR